MGKFLPYEMRISLPYDTYNESITFRDLPRNLKVLRAQDPYMLAYKVWYRIKEIRDMRGSLEWMCVDIYPYLRQGKSQRPHTYTHKDLYRIAGLMKPADAYNPHKMSYSGYLTRVDLGDVEPSPLRDLCGYACDLGIYVAARQWSDHREEGGSKCFGVSFWRGSNNMTIFVAEGNVIHMWTPHGGQVKLSSLQDVFTRGIAELRAF